MEVSIPLDIPTRRSCSPRTNQQCLPLSERVEQVVAPHPVFCVSLRCSANCCFASRTYSAICPWPLSLIFGQSPLHWLFYRSSMQLGFFLVCQIICKLCFENWVLFNLIMNNTCFHYAKILASSPFWFWADAFVLHVYKGSRRKWKCILGNQVLTNWFTQITQTDC